MARDGAIISVIDDVAPLRDVLVQGPVCAPAAGSARGDGNAGRAVLQHGRFVAELQRAGVVVRHLDAALCSTLGFADARDWIVERRVGEYENDRRRGSEIISWMSEQPAETLTRFLIEGMRMSQLPPGFNRPTEASELRDGWFLPPLSDLTQIRGTLRFIDAGAVVCPLQAELSRASAITASTVLNFAPLFDEARFEFWLTSDGADRSCPPIDGRDLAMPGGLVCVAAITRATSVQALSELAASLLRKNRGYRIFWLDLTATSCESLDDCFVPLGRDCALVDSEVLGTASAFAVRPSRHGMALTIEPCQSAFLKEIARVLGTADIRLIDAKNHAGSVRNALNRLAPVVLSPGRVLVFEDHRAAFPVLEEHGIEIVSALDGSALSRDGKGPRGLVSALHAG
ncbi:MAG: hypothetical protein KUA43_20770 [Hoeflea sp.]|uniref:arginine deiminase family protein n=1 Tax=Hoeflea sp. TaxID=1940281 RepID=UPI001D8010D7|nr:arginine deiminase family protein [Hoeflea sp.]MBU4528751.1 hypothetical protein [Alphaproteobacteria bacterium]MBU4545922.1 hypothetical protein [Alphaproteobacteria bacterium]MBU4549885.1 hypothetical protein [Alphaproteobacteria bacterium]MBV1725882.1 hypothetical protein [Hoeflea sp.]MBV1762607.1 hypothetical protein [Hoeflea sp.]